MARFNSFVMQVVEAIRYTALLAVILLAVDQTYAAITDSQPVFKITIRRA